MYLKSRVDCPGFGDGLLNHNWSVVHNRSNPVSEFNRFITFLIDRCVPSKVIRRKVNDKAWFNKDCVNAFHYKQNAYRHWSQNRYNFVGGVCHA